MSPVAPDFLYHGSISVFSRPDVRKGVADRLITRFERVEWRDFA